MIDSCILDGTRQTLITRLASINSAIAVLNLTCDKPAAVTVDEVLVLAAHLERWAWRDLTHEELAVPPPTEQPEAADAPTPTPTDHADHTNTPPVSLRSLHSNSQQTNMATTKQLNAIFAIGKAKGYGAQSLNEWVTGQFHKSMDELTGPEASKLITALKAL